MATTPEEEQRRLRRKRLIRGLAIGGAALGLPALFNQVVSRRARSLPPPRWSEALRYDWREGSIAFRRLGAGPPLLLLHSFGPGYAGLQWRAVAERLAERFEVVVPDLLGWGDSDRPGRIYDGELYISLLHDLLEDVVRRRAVIVSSGLSSAYALQVAVDAPERVRALGMVVPLGIDLHGDEPDLKDAVVHRLLRLPLLGTSSLNVFTSRQALAHHLRREAFADPEAVTAAIIDQHYRAAHLPGAHNALAAYLAGYLNHQASDLLERVQQPVWLAWGRHALSPAVESSDLWLSRLADPRLEVFDDAATLPQTETPEAFSRALLHFLDGLRG